MKKLLFALVAGGVLAITSSQVAQAQVVTFTFLAKVVGGDWDGQTGFGSFTYDSGLLTGSGDEYLWPTDLTTELTILGQSFDETDDSWYPSAPLVSFVDGWPTLMSWWIEEPPSVINELGVEAIKVEGELKPPSAPGANYRFEVQTEVVGTMVPEPSSIAFSTVAGLSLGIFLIRRRRAAKAS